MDGPIPPLSALTWTALMNTSPEEVLDSLSEAQLLELERNVRRLKKKRETRSHPLEETMVQPQLPYPTIFSDPGINNSTIEAPDIKTQSSTITKEDGIEYLIFTYPTRGHEQEYTIRVDIDSIRSHDLPETFRHENCVYPRACVPIEEYTGNRYEYETSVNDIAWRLTWLNRNLLSGRRGLIQRAVDSYRNRFQESRSRRVVRQEKINNGTLRRKAQDLSTAMPVASLDSSHDMVQQLDPYPYARRMHDCDFEYMRLENGAMVDDGKEQDNEIVIYYEEEGDPVTLPHSEACCAPNRLRSMRLCADVGQVNLADLNEAFKMRNCLYPCALDPALYVQNEAMYHYEMAMNEIGWKLAFLNAAKLSGRKDLLLAAVDAFRARRYRVHGRNGEKPMRSVPMHAIPITSRGRKRSDEMMDVTLASSPAMIQSASMEEHAAALIGHYRSSTGNSPRF